MKPTYSDLFSSTMKLGTLVPSRYGETREVVGRRVTVSAGEIPQRTHLAPAIGWLEMLQFVSGFFDKPAYERSAPRAMLDLFTETGAYGPRVSDQLDTVVSHVLSDPGSRQHLLYVGRPGDQYTADMPCTLTIQFLVRGGRLTTHVSMRSSDVVKGLPYDLMMFGGLTLAVARATNQVPGIVVVDAASSHVYLSDADRVECSPDVRVFRLEDDVPRCWAGIRDWASQEVQAAPWPNGLPYGITVLGR